MIGIYKITSPTGKVYIGQSIEIEKRWMRYKNITKSVKKQPAIYNSLLKYGAENHIFEVIEECEIEQLNIRERYWQDFYEVIDKTKGLNCVLTKTGDRSGKASEETILKRSGKNNGMYGIKGEDNPLYGIPRKEETKKKMSEAQKGEKGFWYGKKLPQQSIDKRVAKMIGVKQSKQHIEKRRDLIRAKYILLNIETGVYYFGYVEASDSISMNVKTFWQKVNRNKKNTTNFILV